MPVFDFDDIWIADPDDPNYPEAPTMRVVDLNVLDQDCTEGFGVMTGSIRWRAQEGFRETSFGSYLAAGDLQAAHNYGRGVLEMVIIFKHDDGAAAREAQRDLASWLSVDHGVLGMQLRGDVEPLYFDYVASPSVTMLRGQPQALEKMSQGVDPDGMPLQLFCHPHPRLAPRYFGPFAIDNTYNGRDFLVDNSIADVPSEMEWIVQPTAGACIGIRYGIRDHGNLDEYREFYARPLNDANDKVDTDVEAVNDAMDDLAMVTDFASEETMARRVRETRPVDDATAVEGVHVAYLRERPVNGTVGTSKFRERLKYGFTSSDLVMEDATPIAIDSDWRDVQTPNFIEQELGIVVIPKGVRRAIFELHAERTKGNQDLASDMIVLYPADYQHGIVGVPGFRHGAYGRTYFEPNELNGTGELKRDAYRLNEEGEVAYTFPNAGLKLPAGVYEFEVEAMVTEPNTTTDDDAIREIGIVEAVFQPTVTPEVREDVILRSRQDHREPIKVVRTLAFQVTSADAAAEKRVRLQIRQLADTANGRRIDIIGATLRMMEAFSADAPLVFATAQRVVYVRDGVHEGAPLFSAIHENEPLMAPPRPFVTVMGLIDRAVDPGYQEIDEREPVGRSVSGRRADVTVKITPRRWGP